VGHRKLGQKSIAELLEIQKAENATKDKQDKSTKDFVSSKEIIPRDAQSIPMNKRDWLYEAGFSDKMIHNVSDYIYYSPALNRIGFRGLNLVGRSKSTQLRSIDGSYPKYLNRGETLYLHNMCDDYVVIVEDWLSALRLMQLDISVVCLFGTNLKDDYIMLIKKFTTCKTVYIWLDNDPAGHKGTKEAKRSLKLYTELDIKTISTLKDPKMYTDAMILNTLNLVGAKNNDYYTKAD